MEQAVERKALNEATFRTANEKIQAARVKMDAIEGRTPYLWECDDADCREIVRLGIEEYEAVRANPAAFFVVRGHPHDSGRVLDEHEGYLVVEKQGAARRIALETDPRSEGG